MCHACSHPYRANFNKNIYIFEFRFVTPATCCSTQGYMLRLRVSPLARGPRGSPEMVAGVRVVRQRVVQEAVDSTPSTPPTPPVVRPLGPEWLVEMSNEVENMTPSLFLLSTSWDNDGGANRFAGIERQVSYDALYSHLPVGPPGSLDHAQDSMTSRQRALHVARQRMQIARTDVELYQIVHTLAVALGASRCEEGTIKALHAVLLQMEQPAMSEKEAYTSMGASLSNYKKWRRRVRNAQPCREKEQFRVGALASGKQHQAPGKRPAPPASACLSSSAEGKLFVAESLDTQDTLENMTAEEAIEMAMPLVWRQLQLGAPSTSLRARGETEGPTSVQIWNEGREQSYFADLLQDELDRFPTTDAPAAPQLQRTTAPQLQLTSAAMPAPPAPTAAPPPVRWATRMLLIGMPIEVPMPLLNLSPLPLLPCQQRLPCPAAPPRATAAPSRAPELLAAAAALRSFVEQLLAAGR